MAIASINLTALKKAKNAVIGNPSAKIQLARDGVFIRMYVVVSISQLAVSE